MRTKNHKLNYDNYYIITLLVGGILCIVLAAIGFGEDIKVNKANYDILVEKRAKLYEQSILEYKSHLTAEKTRAPYKVRSQQCCKAIPNKPLPISAIPLRFKYGF